MEAEVDRTGGAGRRGRPRRRGRARGSPGESQARRVARSGSRPIATLEPHRAGRTAVDLDHEQSERLRLALGALDRGEIPSRSFALIAGEIRLDLLVGEELDEEVGVLDRRSPQLHVSTAAGRLIGRHTPDPSATPPRIRPSPPSMVGRSGSSRISRPVDEGGHGQQVRDEREPGGAEEAQHPEEDELRDRRARRSRARAARRPASSPGRGPGSWKSAERKQDERRRRASTTSPAPGPAAWPTARWP